VGSLYLEMTRDLDLEICLRDGEVLYFAKFHELEKQATGY